MQLQQTLGLTLGHKLEAQRHSKKILHKRVFEHKVKDILLALDYQTWLQQHCQGCL